MKKLLLPVRRHIKSITSITSLHSLRSVLCLLFPWQPQVHELRGRDRLASWEMHSQLPHSQLPGCPWQVQRWAEQPFMALCSFFFPSSTSLLICFYSSACHSSCSSCWGPSVSQCSLCPGGLLLHQGQCVEACGEGLYPQDDTCHSENCFPSPLFLVLHLKNWWLWLMSGLRPLVFVKPARSHSIHT